MSTYVAKGDKDFEAGAAAAPKSHKIRITLTSRNVKNLEKGEATFPLSLYWLGWEEGVGRRGEGEGVWEEEG